MVVAVVAVAALMGVVVVADKLVKFSNSVAEEEKQLKSLKNVLGTQGTLRPIFESQLKQKRLVRNRAMNLRRTMAEAGLDYEPAEDIEEIVKLVEDHFKLGDNKLDPVAVNGNS